MQSRLNEYVFKHVLLWFWNLNDTLSVFFFSLQNLVLELIHKFSHTAVWNTQNRDTNKKEVKKTVWIKKIVNRKKIMFNLSKDCQILCLIDGTKSRRCNLNCYHQILKGSMLMELCRLSIYKRMELCRLSEILINVFSIISLYMIDCLALLSYFLFNIELNALLHLWVQFQLQTLPIKYTLTKKKKRERDVLAYFFV